MNKRFDKKSEEEMSFCYKDFLREVVFELDFEE